MPANRSSSRTPSPFTPEPRENPKAITCASGEHGPPLVQRAVVPLPEPPRVAGGRRPSRTGLAPLLSHQSFRRSRARRPGCRPGAVAVEVDDQLEAGRDRSRRGCVVQRRLTDVGQRRVVSTYSATLSVLVLPSVQMWRAVPVDLVVPGRPGVAEVQSKSLGTWMTPSAGGRARACQEHGGDTEGEGAPEADGSLQEMESLSSARHDHCRPGAVSPVGTCTRQSVEEIGTAMCGGRQDEASGDVV